MLVVRVKDSVDLLGVYRQPIAPKRERAHWEAERAELNDVLIELTATLVTRDALILGDLNTGQPRLDKEHGTFRRHNPYERIVACGWVDAFRRLHPTAVRFSHWQSRRDGGYNGLRLDHAFISPGMAPRLSGAEYVDAVNGLVLVRPWGSSKGTISDHSALVVELD